LVFPIDII